MNILHCVEFYHPSVGGSQEVVRQISERLAKNGHLVSVATSFEKQRKNREINGVKITSFNIKGNPINGFKGEIVPYQNFLLSNHFDLLMIYGAQHWAAALALPILDRLSYPVILAPVGFAGMKNPAYEDYYNLFFSNLNLFQHFILHSNTYQDMEYLRRICLSNITTIPNGADENEFLNTPKNFRQKHHISEKTPILLTIGSHTRMKGHSHILEAYKLIKTPAILTIIGNLTLNRFGCLPDDFLRGLKIQIQSLGKKRVLILNPPRDEVLAAYRAADLFVFGSNMECSPLVLFEALASKTPFLSLACGNAKEIVDWSGGGKILPTYKKENGWVEGDPIQTALEIDKMLQDTSERKALADSGYNSWLREFTWARIAEQYESLYLRIITDWLN